MGEPVHRDSLKDEATRVVEEARMVLPGLQALFGFQLIAVFNERFSRDLAPGEQAVHLVAVVLVAIAGILLMAPAAYQRQVERGVVTRYFVKLGSGLVFTAMLPLAAGLSLDIFLLGRLIVHSVTLACGVAGGVFLTALTMWFLFPRIARHRRSPLE
jgi:H+/Cl- antiporter ClcA